LLSFLKYLTFGSAFSLYEAKDKKKQQKRPNKKTANYKTPVAIKRLINKYLMQQNDQCSQTSQVQKTPAT